jgi:hypothetical protein
MNYYITLGKWISYKNFNTSTHRYNILKSEDDDVYKVITWISNSGGEFLLGASFMTQEKLCRVFPDIENY